MTVLSDPLIFTHDCRSVFTLTLSRLVLLSATTRRMIFAAGWTREHMVRTYMPFLGSSGSSSRSTRRVGTVCLRHNHLARETLGLFLSNNQRLLCHLDGVDTSRILGEATDTE